MARASTGGRYLWKHARGLNVWRVTSEGVKNNGHQEKQNDVIARSILLSSLDDDIFSVYFHAQVRMICGRPSKRTMRAQRMCQMKNIKFSLGIFHNSSNMIMKMHTLGTHV